jgi:hypothetical protein
LIRAGDRFHAHQYTTFQDSYKHISSKFFHLVP